MVMKYKGDLFWGLDREPTGLIYMYAKTPKSSCRGLIRILMFQMGGHTNYKREYGRWCDQYLASNYQIRHIWQTIVQSGKWIKYTHNNTPALKDLVSKIQACWNMQLLHLPTNHLRYWPFRIYWYNQGPIMKFLVWESLHLFEWLSCSSGQAEHLSTWYNCLRL